MKNFLKYVLATIVGIMIVNFMVFFFLLAFVGIVTALSEKTVNVQDNSVLTITLSSPLSDRTSANPLDNFDFLSLNPQERLGLNQILESIEYAAYDPKIRGIYLNLTDIQGNFGGLASTEELRQALLQFKESGKFIYSYSNLGYSQKAYYLATVADSIFVNPETPLLLTGMSSNVTFYKEALDKLGIRPEIVKVGKFKSAVEPFIATEMSDANREQVQKYLGTSWNHVVQGIAESRDIPADSIQALTDRFDFYTTEQLRAWGYFDGVCYEDEMLAFLKAECGIPAHKGLRQVALSDYRHIPATARAEARQTQDKIAIIYAQGEIGLEQNTRSIGPDFVKSIRKAREDQQVKAIVLRVNSPGGSALTSDLIWREVKLAKAAKPVVVSMGDVAASGGYYISCAADVIVAEPTTLTGSIGIFGMFFSGDKLIREKLGIHTETVRTNAHSDFGGSYPLPLPVSSRPLSRYEKRVLQNYVNQGYETFLSRVMEGRSMERNELDAIAQGRVWTGKDAQAIGLVDMLGGLNHAIGIAAGRAGIDSYDIVEYPTLKNPLEELISQLSGTIRMRILKDELGEGYATWQEVKAITRQQGILARMPFHITDN